jgi:peroxiredoxin
VTQGDPARAQVLCDRMQAPFPCLADPGREGYRTYGLKRGNAWEVIGPAAIARGLQARRKGHRIEKIEGDAFQMPGTFVIDSDGTVRYARYGRHSGDHPDPRELIEALERL